MSKFCPHTNSKVVYLVCQECEDRICERPNRPRVTILPKKDKDTTKADSAPQKATESLTEIPRPVISGDKPHCTSCCNCNGCSEEMLGGKLINSARCKVYHNYVIDVNKVSIHGCEYHNKDMSDEKICMNCECFLGGGDWGLACSDDYYKLPSALSPACENFKKKQ